MEKEHQLQLSEKDKLINELKKQIEEVLQDKVDLEQEVMVIQKDVQEMAMQNNRVEQGMINKVQDLTERLRESLEQNAILNDKVKEMSVKHSDKL